MNTSAGDPAEARLAEYAREFLRGYKWAIDINYSGARKFIHEAGLDDDYFPLYGRKLGVDVAIAALFTKADFYMFFVKQPDTDIANYLDCTTDPSLSKGWTFSVPHDQRIQTVKIVLDLEDSDLFKLSAHINVVNVPEADMMAFFMPPMGQQGYRHGIDFGNSAGVSAEDELPRIKEQLKTASTRTQIMTATCS